MASPNPLKGEIIEISGSELEKVQWQGRPDPNDSNKWFYDQALVGIDPKVEANFEQWVLLDVVTNYAEKHNHTASEHHTRLDINNRRGHAMELYRADKKDIFQRFRNLTAMVGPSFQNIQRLQRIEGSWNYDQAEQYVNDPTQIESRLVPVIHPEEEKPKDRKLDKNIHKDSLECDQTVNYTEPDKFLWVDLTYPLRGIYIPVKKQGDATDPYVRKYAYFNFTKADYKLHQYTNVPKGRNEPSIPDEEIKRQEHEEERRKHNDPNFNGTPGMEPPIQEKRNNKFKKDKPAAFTKNAHIGWGIRPGLTARFDVNKLEDLAVATDAGNTSNNFDATHYIGIFQSKDIVIRWGGRLNTRMERMYNDPVHTMNDREVVRDPNRIVTHPQPSATPAAPAAPATPATTLVSPSA
jgi:hypothetical protein